MRDASAGLQVRLPATIATEAAARVGLLSLPGVTALGDGAARELSRHGGTLSLGGLRELGGDDARRLGDHRDWLLLDGVASLSVAASKGLSRHRGGLSLRGLASLDVAAATALARSRGDLHLDGLAELTPEVATALADLRGMLSLDGLRTASQATLEALAGHAGGLSLGGLTTLTEPAAAALAGHRGRLALDGLEQLEPAAAARLGRHRGGLSLSGLTALDPASARCLAAGDGDLRLDGLKQIEADTIAALAAAKGWLSLAGIIRLDTAAAAALAGRTGRVALPNLREIDAADLERLRTNPAIDLPRGLPSTGRSMSASGADRLPEPEPLGVAIIGGGFAGIAMAIALLEQGRRDFAILEKAATLGGTWRDNTYPGCACDVPSRLYSYSFAADAEWSRDHAPQAEILAYLEQVARRHDVHRFTRFETAIERIEWDASARLWRLAAADGRRFSARVVVSAVGGIHIPHVPELPGLDRFAGPAFHTARWRHDLDLAGRHVAVVGTGATAVQIVPEIARVAERLTIYQRTPPWVLPRRDRPVSQLARWLDARVPGLRAARRQWLYWTAEARAIPLAHLPRLVVHPQRQAKAFLKRSLPDTRLRRKLVPDYALGCKRVLKSDDYFPALGRDHVEVVVEPIDRIGSWQIATRDGIARPADVIILATGFRPFDLSEAVEVVGRGGRSLAETWKDGPEAYHGLAVAGFPNLFLLMGPNTALGHNSILVMIEAQVRYVSQCLGWLERGELPTIEVTPEAQHAANAALHERFERSVWRSGSLTGTGGSTVAPCTSWYRHATGRNHVIWPGTATSYVNAVRTPDLAAFRAPVAAGSGPRGAGESAAESRAAA